MRLDTRSRPGAWIFVFFLCGALLWSATLAAQVETLLVEGSTANCAFSGSPSCTATVECPPGFVLAGGGVRGFESHVEASYPSSTTAWTTTWYRADEIYASAADALATPWAICVAAPVAGLEVVSGSTIVCAQETPSCTTDLECPAGKALIGGGFEGVEAKLESSRPSSLSTWSVTWYPADDLGEYGIFALGEGTIHLLCADAAPAGLELVAASTRTCDSAAPACRSAIACPPGKVVLGGGLFGLELKAEAAWPLAPRSWRASWFLAFDEYGFAAEALGSAVALCATGTNQQPLLFADDFEHEDTSLWSSTVGLQ